MAWRASPARIISLNSVEIEGFSLSTLTVAVADPLCRFHGIRDNPYPFTNDEVEQYRLDELHNSLRELLGGNIYVPLSSKATRIGQLCCRILLTFSGHGLWFWRMGHGGRRRISFHFCLWYRSFANPGNLSSPR